MVFKKTKIKKIFRGTSIFLFVLFFCFSNLPMYFISGVVSEYIADKNIVDNLWHLQSDKNIVDKLNPLQRYNYLGVGTAEAATQALYMTVTNAASPYPTTTDLYSTTAGSSSNVTTYARNGTSTGFYQFKPGVTNTTSLGTTAASLPANPTNSGWLYSGTNLDGLQTDAGNWTINFKYKPYYSTAPTTKYFWYRVLKVTCSGGTCSKVTTISPTDTANGAPASSGWSRFTLGTLPTSNTLSSMQTITFAASALSWASGEKVYAEFVINSNTTGSSTRGWYLEEGTSSDAITTSNVSTPPNSPPTVSVSQPPSGNTTVAAGSSYDITYTLADSDSVATAALYYDTNNDGVGGTAISGCGAVAEGTNAVCSFSTSVLTPGTPYYIYAVATDGVNPNVTAVSSGTITVNAAPTLSISQPDGVGDTVTVGDTYNLTYSLADPDNVVTVAFYYDTNNSGLNGTAITGCGSVAEGTNMTCSWNTTGMTPGSYYVYAITNDGVNSQVSAYSSGQITINSVGSLSVDVVDSGGASVASPSVSFAAKTFDWVAQASSGTLGTSSQKIRVNNTTSTATWGLSISATSGPTTLWTDGTNTYDFNGSSAAGRLQIDASGSTITPQGGCATTGLTKGLATYFAQGTQDSIGLVTAGGSAQTGCYWDITGISLTQDIPAAQIPSTYTLNLTLTAA